MSAEAVAEPIADTAAELVVPRPDSSWGSLTPRRARKRLEAIVDRRFKYEQSAFGPYRDELARLLSALEPRHAAERLVHEAVLELRVVGGAVLDARGAPVATAGIWPSHVVDSVAIPGGGKTVHSLALGPRSDGAPPDPRARAALDELVGLVAATARVDRPRR